MAFISNQSCVCLKSELDLFSAPPTQTVLFKQSVKKHVPIALKEVVKIVKFQSGSGAPKSKHRRVNSHRHQRRRHYGGGCGSGRRRRQHFNGIIA